MEIPAVRRCSGTKLGLTAHCCDYSNRGFLFYFHSTVKYLNLFAQVLLSLPSSTIFQCPILAQMSRKGFDQNVLWREKPKNPMYSEWTGIPLNPNGSGGRALYALFDYVGGEVTFHT
jgi:hypothetical protein